MPKNATNYEFKENPVFIELSSILGNGFILSLFTIDFLCFEYALPILGASIMFYGCHLIRLQNTYFKKAYTVSLLRLCLMLLNFLLDWTSIYENRVIMSLQLICSITLITLLFYYLNTGFRGFYQEAGIPKYSNHLVFYIPLYWCTLAATYLAHRLGVLGALISIPILLLNILYIAIVFYRLGKSLSTTELEIDLNYFSKDSKQKILLLLCSYLVLLTVTIFLSNKGAFFESTSIIIDTNIATTSNEIRQKLQRLGMDEAIIDDLSLDSTEFNEFASAQAIYQNKDTYQINGGELELSIFNVKRPEDYRLLIYYQWISEPSNRLYHIIECQSEDFNNVTNLNSRCLYDTVSQDKSTYQLSSISTGLNDGDFPYTHQKLSNDGTRLRGYLAFSYTTINDSNDPLNLILNYYYQVSIFNLPYINIMDYMNHYDHLSSSYVYSRLSIPFTQME